MESSTNMESSGEVGQTKQHSHPESSSSRDSEVSGRDYSELKAEDPPAPSLSEVEDAVTSANGNPPVESVTAQLHQSHEEVKTEEGSTSHEEIKAAVPSNPYEEVKAEELTRPHEQVVGTEPPKLYQEAEAAVPTITQTPTADSAEPHRDAKTAEVAKPVEEVKTAKPQDERPKLTAEAVNPLAGTPKPLQAEQPLQTTAPQQQTNPPSTKPHHPEDRPEAPAVQEKGAPITVSKTVVKSEGSQAHEREKEITTEADSKPVSKMEDQPPKQSTSSRLPSEGRSTCGKCRVL
jgi:hypothetical protein